MLPVAILAGGLATRLRPVSSTIPKAMIDINGEPFVAHQLRLLKQSGIERVVFCVGYLGEMIREYVGNGRNFGLAVDYSFDGPALRGTAGAVINALPLLGKRFFVLYGDSYLTCDYGAVEQAFLASGKRGLMTVFRNRNRWEKSNVEFAGRQILEYDKKLRTNRMEHVDYGLSAFISSAFPGHKADGPQDLAGIFQSLLRADGLAGFEVTERFYEVGSWDGIQALQGYLNSTTLLRTPA